MLGKRRPEAHLALHGKRDRDDYPLGPLDRPIVEGNGNFRAAVLQRHDRAMEAHASVELLGQSLGEGARPPGKSKAKAGRRSARRQLRGVAEQRHLVERHARRGDRNPELGSASNSRARACFLEPAGQRLVVKDAGAVDVLRMIGVDPRGERRNLSFEGLEELRVAFVQIERRIRFPSGRFNRRNAYFIGEQAQGRVLVIERLAPGVEACLPHRNPPRSTADSVAGLQNLDVDACAREPIRARQPGDTGADDDHLSSRRYSRSSRTSPKRTPSTHSPWRQYAFRLTPSLTNPLRSAWRIARSLNP